VTGLRYRRSLTDDGQVFRRRAPQPAAPTDDRAPARVAELTAMNRRARTADRDRELLRQRRAAFPTLLASGPAGNSKSEPVPDPFPGRTGVIEINGRDLDRELVAGTVRAHGCLLVREFLPPETVQMLLERVEAVFAAWDRWPTATAAEKVELARVYEPYVPDADLALMLDVIRSNRDRERIMLADSPSVHFDVCEALDACGVRDLLEAYFGDTPAMTVTKSAMHRMSLRDNVLGFHQDTAVFDNVARGAMNFWIALTACGVDAPGLEVLPMRLNAPLERTHGRMAVDPALIDSLGVPTVIPRFEPGDALVFDEFLVHRTAMAPQMSNVRYSLENWFFTAASLPPSEGGLVF
jgi:hypothetical protein